MYRPTRDWFGEVALSAHANSRARHGFGVNGLPPVTPTMANAGGGGSAPVGHCGKEMSLPNTEFGGAACGVGVPRGGGVGARRLMLTWRIHQPLAGVCTYTDRLLGPSG